MIHKKFALFLKHTFVPHHGNDYKPHFFREHVILSFLIGSIFLLLLSFTTYIVIRTTTYGSSVVSTVLIDLTNEIRKEQGLNLLLYNKQLSTAATLKGNDMVLRQYFAHYAPDGTTPWHWFEKVGYNFNFAGENLAINFRSSTEVQKAWLASPKHRDNILDPKFEDIGIATVPGVTSDKVVLFVVQLFGKQKPVIGQSELGETPSSLTAGSTSLAQGYFNKILFNASYYINNMYTTFIVILLVALALMIFIEIRKQHVYHILYGVLLFIVIIICIAINSLLL